MRTNAREIAFNLLFEKEYGPKNETNESLFFDELCADGNVVSDEDKLFINSLVSAVVDNKKDIKKKIVSSLIDYSFDRIHRVDSVVLLLAVAELTYFPETEKKVVINEAVNLAKKFGGEKSTGFVNGILATIVKE